jgi:hypothetical protein
MFRTTRTRTEPNRPRALRPRLDALEGRQLLSAGALDTTTFKTAVPSQGPSRPRSPRNARDGRGPGTPLDA